MESGATFFLRCATCQEMYVAASGWNIRTGGDDVAWLKPKKKRKPVACAHPVDAVERWDGTAWVSVTVTRGKDTGT
jgi:hypothetical protein